MSKIIPLNEIYTNLKLKQYSEKAQLEEKQKKEREELELIKKKEQEELELIRKKEYEELLKKREEERKIIKEIEKLLINEFETNHEFTNFLYDEINKMLTNDKLDNNIKTCYTITKFIINYKNYNNKDLTIEKITKLLKYNFLKHTIKNKDSSLYNTCLSIKKYIIIPPNCFYKISTNKYIDKECSVNDMAIYFKKLDEFKSDNIPMEKFFIEILDHNYNDNINGGFYIYDFDIDISKPSNNTNENNTTTSNDTSLNTNENNKITLNSVKNINNNIEIKRKKKCIIL